VRVIRTSITAKTTGKAPPVCGTGALCFTAAGAFDVAGSTFDEVPALVEVLPLCG
jgi:hypothetical protein